MPHRSRSSESARTWRERGVRGTLGADAAAREALDRLAHLAARTLHAPVGQLGLVTDDRRLSVIALCVIDFTPRVWSTDDVGMLDTLAAFVVAELERRGRMEAELVHLSTILESSGDAIVGEPTVLLVEDEAAVRALARRALARAGYRVLEAEDGEAGLRVADGHGGVIDLLLIDVMMPRMGGRELAERLTAAVPGMRVLYTSGYAEEGTMRDGGLRGADFLQKPYGPAELVAKARQVLDGPGVDR